MNKALVVYDNTGFIYNITYGTDKTELPILSSMFVDVPDGRNINSIDVSTETPTPVYDELPLTEMADIKNSVDTINGRIDNIMDMLNVITAAVMNTMGAPTTLPETGDVSDEVQEEDQDQNPDADVLDDNIEQ